ncbi:MAG: penicillin acylase family protein [Minwuia sp.]|uniref:penicillin acylase family protein n=1 Tax=Minwuia sp. TaxID=2493630 RepID=UPI003A87611D
MTRSLTGMLSTVAVAALVAGCSLFTSIPEQVSIADRIAQMETGGLDLAEPVEIRWNSHMVPWITAGNDSDAAYALGYVHAHLRLGQMEIARRLASGRVAEIAGPLAADIDETVRLIGYYRGAEQNYQKLPPATREWLDRFADGVNAYLGRIDELPHEYKLFAFKPEPWTPVDILAFGRLAGSDVNWLTSIGMLALTSRPDWPEIWREAMNFNGGAIRSVAEADGERDAAVKLAALLDMIGAHARSGSNAWAVNGARSASGAPMMATDPHLGITAPNIWLLAGLKTPSYEVVGMMPAGMPIFGLGRNRDLAWGATNLRARSSDLIDVTAIPESELRTETDVIVNRFGFDREVIRRYSPWGPLITDSPLVNDPQERRIALKWIGHQFSDELTAYMDGARASTIAEFRTAFDDYAIPGLAFVLATADGDIAIGTAAKLPDRPLDSPRDLVLDPPAPGEANPWDRIYTAGQLPWIVNPDEGFVASANNPTAPFEAPMTLFDTPPDRISVLKRALAEARDVDRDYMAALQRNTHSPSAMVLRDAILDLAERADLRDQVPPSMADWDGDYEIESRGALAFEAFVAALTPKVYEKLGEEDVLEVIGRWSWFRVKLAADLRRLGPKDAADAVAHAISESRETVDEFGEWGRMHRLQLRHPLANAPVIGGRYVFGDVPGGGSNETVMKSAHNPTEERHPAFYGSQARQISDMSDPDANWFVILGGQDGWLNAEGFTDQLPLWQRGEYIRMPLSRERVEAEFERITVLTPKG